MEQEKTKIQALLEMINGYAKRHDRGALADLRHGLSEGTAYRAWPHLARFGINNEHNRVIWQLIGAGAASAMQKELPVRTETWLNLGSSLRLIAMKGHGSVDEKLNAMDGRMRRLLSCNDAGELCHHLPGILRMAMAKGVVVDYERLYWDLHKWHKGDVAVQWAAQYWGENSTGEGKGVSG